MFRRIIISVLIFIVSLSFCSCWDSLDVNEKGMATTIVVGKEDDEDIFWVEFANLGGGQSEGSGDGGGEKFTIVKATGETYAMTRKALDNKLPKPTFLGTVRIVAFTESMAKEGVAEYCNRMRNLQEYRKALNIIVIPDEAEELFDANKESSMSTGHTIEATVHKLNKTGNSVDSSLSQILDWLSGKHNCFLLPHFVAEEELLNLDGYSVINEGDLVSFIPMDESTGIHYLLNDFVISTYTVPYDKYNATVEVHLKGKKVETSYRNNQVNYDIHFDFFALVKYLDTTKNLTTTYELEVEENLADLIADDLNIAINTSQTEPQSDYFDLCEYFRVKYPNIFKDMDWEEEYANAKFKFSLNINLLPGREYDYNPQVDWKGKEDE